MRRVAALLIVGLLGAATAWAANPAPPKATTGSAGGVGTSVATLTGTVDSGNADSAYWFSYGTSTTYGLTSSTQTTPAATAPATVTAVITGLTPATPYHYQLTATNPAGKSSGNDATLTTAVAPAKPAATTNAASGVTRTGATLNASVDPNALATTYVFQYGTSTTYGSTTPVADVGSGTAAVAVKQTIAGLKAGTTYHYRVVATNAMGPTNGADHTFKTGAAAIRPTVTTNNATKVNANSATLNGRIDPNGVNTSYVFQYGTTKSYGQTTPVQSAGAGTAKAGVSAAVTGLKVHTTYHFRLVATSANGVFAGGDHSFYTSSSPLALTFGIRPDPVVFGHAIALFGNVSGAGSGITVTLHGQAFPFSAPAVVIGNPIHTDSKGAYRFVLPGATTRTRYFTTAALAGTSLTSQTIISRVRVRVGLSVTKLGGHLIRFHGTILPAVQGGTIVSIQRRSPSGARWVRLAHATLLGPARPGGALRFAKRMTLHRGGAFRAVVLPNDGVHTRNVSRTRVIRFH